MSEASAAESRAAELEAALTSYGLSPIEVAYVVHACSSNFVGLLIYGSVARGDAIKSSDVDLLALREDAGIQSERFARVSISSYSADQFRSASRTLYGTHLKRDAKVVYDPQGTIRVLLDELEPADPDELLARVQRYSTILNQRPDTLNRFYWGLTRLARYLLRTAVYAKAMSQGSPCFSVRELAQRFNDPELAQLLASDPSVTGNPSLPVLAELESRLFEIVGTPTDQSWSSLEEIALTFWEGDRSLAALAIRAMGPETWDAFDYADLPKVIL